MMSNWAERMIVSSYYGF